MARTPTHDPAEARARALERGLRDAFEAPGRHLPAARALLGVAILLAGAYASRRCGVALLGDLLAYGAYAILFGWALACVVLLVALGRGGRRELFGRHGGRADAPRRP